MVHGGSIHGKTLCKTKKNNKEILLPIILYMDSISTDNNGKLNLTPLAKCTQERPSSFIEQTCKRYTEFQITHKSNVIFGLSDMIKNIPKKDCTNSQYLGGAKFAIG